MSKKHIFLSIFSKITIFACVFCAVPAWSDTTTCDIDFTPVTGNSWQNGTPTPTSPVEIESVGTKVGNKYQISVTAQGKNLFDKDSNYLIHKPCISGGTFPNTSSTWANSITYFFDVKPNTTYTYSCATAGDRIGVFAMNTPVNPNNYTEKSSLHFDRVIVGVTSSNIPTTYTFTTNANEHQVAIYCALNTAPTNIQIEEGSTATSYAPYSVPTTTPIYLNAPLRKVGDYADVLDYKNGTITRNVGVKVFDGTESWAYSSSRFSLQISDYLVGSSIMATIISHYKLPAINAGSIANGEARFGKAIPDSTVSYNNTFIVHDDNYTDLNGYKAWLAQQYAAGTPVTIYYPLATPVVEQIENWSCPVPITDIKIATTKMVEDEFAAAEAQLATTVQTIESVVSRTIAQTGQIATLHETKQTRPDESCPANMKCLLVQDEDGTPHWYPIIEP